MGRSTCSAGADGSCGDIGRTEIDRYVWFSITVGVMAMGLAPSLALIGPLLSTVDQDGREALPRRRLDQSCSTGGFLLFAGALDVEFGDLREHGAGEHRRPGHPGRSVRRQSPCLGGLLLFTVAGSGSRCSCLLSGLISPTDPIVVLDVPVAGARRTRVEIAASRCSTTAWAWSSSSRSSKFGGRPVHDAGGSRSTCWAGRPQALGGAALGLVLGRIAGRRCSSDRGHQVETSLLALWNGGLCCGGTLCRGDDDGHGRDRW